MLPDTNQPLNPRARFSNCDWNTNLQSGSQLENFGGHKTFWYQQRWAYVLFNLSSNSIALKFLGLFYLMRTRCLLTTACFTAIILIFWSGTWRTCTYCSRTGTFGEMFYDQRSYLIWEQNGQNIYSILTLYGSKIMPKELIKGHSTLLRNLESYY